MKCFGIFALLAMSMLAGPALSRQPAPAGQAPAAKSETVQQGCKEMEKHHKQHHATADKSAKSEKHAGCHSDSGHKGKANGEQTHEHGKPSRQS